MKIKNIFILGALICTSSAVLASSAPVIAIQPESQAVIESYEATTSNSVIAQGGYTALNSIVLNPSGSATAYATVDDDGKYILHAGGGDYWNNTEVGCLYLYKDVEGDFDVVLCVESIENNNVWSKVGLAFRSTLDGNSSHVSVLATPSQVQTTYRSPSGSDSKETWPLLIDGNFVEEESINYKDVTYPSNWIRLKREGDHFTAYRSLDGNYWTRLNEGDFTTVDKNTARQMPVEGYLGIVYSAQDQNNYHTAVVSQYNPQYVAPALPTPDPSNYAFTIVGYEDGGVEGFYDYDAETGMFSVWGCGSDVWGTNDHFSYLYRPVPAGDFSLTVKLNDFPATSNGWAKAGLMLRESAADGTFPNNSRYVLMNTQRSYNTSNGLFRSAWRSTIGLDVNDNRSESSPSDYRYPNWQRIERVGNVVFCYYSENGDDWNLLSKIDTGSWTDGFIGSGLPLYIGMFVTSHETSSFDACAYFSDVSFSGEEPIILTPPNIITQPKSQTVNEGSSVTFSVTAEGTKPLNYQWYKDSEVISGAINSNYTIESTQLSDAGSYTVTVSNNAGSVTSEEAILTVEPVIIIEAPVITEQPVSQTVTEGGAVTFNVEVKINNSEYENFTTSLPNGVNLDMVWIEPGTFIMGSPEDEIGRLDFVGEDQHRVVISSGYWLGKYEVTQAQYKALMGENPSRFRDDNNPVEQVSWNDAMSFCEKLTEIEKIAGRLPEGYRYTLPTEAQWEYACRAGTITAFYNGTNIPTEEQKWEVPCSNADPIAWYMHNSGYKTHPIGQKQPNGWGLYDMYGNVWEWCLDWYNSNYYTESPVTDPMGPSTGTYRCARGGSWDNGAYRCRSAAREYDRLPTYNQNGNVGFRVALTTALSYQWYKDGKAISGAIESSYTIENAQLSDAGSYTVTVSNRAGSVTSDEAILTVEPVILIEAPVITKQPASQTVTEGDAVTFNITAKGTEPLAYQWYKDGEEISGATDSSYTISSVESSDTGSYYVVVSNSIGDVTSSMATLTVAPKPAARATINMRSSNAVTYGNTCGTLAGKNVGNEIWGSLLYNGQEIAIQAFALNSSGEPTGKLKGDVIGVDIVPAGTDVILQLAAFDQSYLDHPGTGNYYYGISAPFTYHTGDTSNPMVLPDVRLEFASFTIEWVSKPTITTQPKSQTVDEGSSVTFSVVAAGTAPLSYQWYKDGAEVSGATDASYTISSVTSSDAGSYTVTVSNSTGSVTSNAVTLTVNKPVVSDGTAVRSVKVDGQTATVTLVLLPSETVSVYFVEETVPDIGTVVPSNGGIYTAAKNVIRWSFLDGVAREVSYTITMPSDFSEKVTVSGEVAFDTTVKAIEGETVLDFTVKTHPADTNDDFEISMLEVSAYAVAWKQGKSWSREPADIPMNYVARGALIWINGGDYIYDSSKAKPACWVNAVKAASVEMASASISERKISEADGKANVAIEIIPAEDISIYLVEEQLPADMALNVTDISDGGNYIPEKNVIRWSFLDGEARTLTYTIEPEEGFVGTVLLNGEVMFDEETFTIEGDTKAVFRPIVSFVVEDDGEGLVLNFAGTLYESDDAISWRVVEGAKAPFKVDITQGKKFYRCAQ